MNSQNLTNVTTPDHATFRVTVDTLLRKCFAITIEDTSLADQHVHVEALASKLTPAAVVNDWARRHDLPRVDTGSTWCHGSFMAISDEDADRTLGAATLAMAA